MNTKYEHTQVNEKLVLRFLGGMSLVCFLISIGLVGNAHVLYIYTRIFKPGSNYRIFVIFLAMLDVFNLAVSAPMVVYYLVHPVTFFLNGANVLWPLSIAMAIKADVEATLAKYMTNLNILQKISEG
jgi:type IV secretory pathway TrbL component